MFLQFGVLLLKIWPGKSQLIKISKDWAFRGVMKVISIWRVDWADGSLFMPKSSFHLT